MKRYRKNHTLIDVIARAPEAGLPLFDHAVAAIAPRKVRTATETRDESYRRTVQAGLTESLRVVFDAFREIGPACDREVHVYTKLGVNIITARRNDLIELGLMSESGTAFDSATNRTVQLWRVL